MIENKKFHKPKSLQSDKNLAKRSLNIKRASISSKFGILPLYDKHYKQS